MSGKAGYYPDGDYSSDADWCYGIGAEIQALETALDIDDGTIGDLYSESHAAAFRDGTINPGERDWKTACFDFQVGAYGDTTISLWAEEYEDALETAAEWLADNAPGHLMTEGDEHLEELRCEACQEAGLAYPPPRDADYEQDGYWSAFETAEADLTYTESGYLTSYEFWLGETDPPVVRGIRTDRKGRHLKG